MTLIELLVVISITVVVMGMVITGWWALQKSYAYSARSTEARQYARDAMSRMVREIRDAQSETSGQPLYGEPPIQYAQPNEMRLTTSFNSPGSDGTGDIQQVKFWYDANAQTLYRARDTNGDGGFERTDVLARYIVNGSTPSTANPTAIFQYSYIDAYGNVQKTSSMSDTSRIVSVQIRIIADLNPGKSPTYMDLISTVQPRNQRQI